MNNFSSALFAFIKTPVWESNIFSPFIKKIRTLFYALIYYFAFCIVIGIILACLNALLNSYFNIDLINLRKHNFNNLFKLLGNEYAILTVVLFAPILEETIFRLWLSLNKYVVSVSFAFIILKIITSFNHHNLLLLNFSIYEILISFIVALLFLIFISDKKLTVIRNKHFKFLYYFSAISFGLLHITNFTPIHYIIFWAYPFFILPQLGLGFILGFIRTKYGFIWGILLHISVNFLGSATDIIKLLYHF